MRGLDWRNERYVRSPTRDTPPWMVLGWNTQNLWLQLQRKMDRAGVIALDPELLPHESIVAMLPHAPPGDVERSLEKLISKGWLVLSADGSTLCDPEFLDREEASMTDRQRQHESRRTRRDKARLSQIVTDESQDVTETSQPVTAGHDVSLRPSPSRPAPTQPIEDKAPSEPAAGAAENKEDRDGRSNRDLHSVRKGGPGRDGQGEQEDLLGEDPKEGDARGSVAGVELHQAPPPEASRKPLTPHQERNRYVVEDLLPRWDQEPPMVGQGKKRRIAYATITDWLKVCGNDTQKLEACLTQLSLAGKMGNWSYFAKCLPDWAANGSRVQQRRRRRVAGVDYAEIHAHGDEGESARAHWRWVLEDPETRDTDNLGRERLQQLAGAEAT